MNNYNNIMAVDIETIPYNYQAYKNSKKTKTDVFRDNIYLIGVCLGNGEHYVLNVLNRDGEPKPLPDWFINMYEDKDTLVINHNANFDAKYLWHNYKIRPKNLHDTMPIEKLLTMGTGAKIGLSETLERRYGIKLNKSIRDRIIRGDISEQDYDYVLEDTKYLQLLWEDQTEEINQFGMRRAMYLENRLAWITGQMEYTGIPINKKLWDEYHDILIGVRNQYNKDALDKLGIRYAETWEGEPVDCVNLSSTQQALKVLKSKGILLDNYQKETILESILTSKDDTQLGILTDIYQLKKWVSALRFNYGKEIHPVSKRIHGRTISTGTNTGRLSSKDPNLQNISKDMDYDRYLQKTGINFRKLFEAPEGYKWVASDYSQIELRVLAELTKEDWLVQNFIDGGDVHSASASKALGIKVTKGMYERLYGKVLNFAFAYGGGARAIIGFALNMGVIIPFSKAEELATMFKANNPKVEKWGRAKYKEIKNNRVLQHSAGYRRQFLDDKDIRETIARNTPNQGTAGTIMKEAIVSFYDWIENSYGHDNVQILNIVHDEMNSMCKEDIAEDVLRNKNRIMIEAGQTYMQIVPCEVDGAIGKNWAEAK